MGGFVIDWYINSLYVFIYIQYLSNKTSRLVEYFRLPNKDGSKSHHLEFF